MLQLSLPVIAGLSSSCAFGRLLSAEGNIVNDEIRSTFADKMLQNQWALDTILSDLARILTVKYQLTISELENC